MDFNPQELDLMKRYASRQIIARGAAAGLDAMEIVDIVRRIHEKTPELIAHIKDRKQASDPIRIAFLAFEDFWKSQEIPLYKPWISWRFYKISQAYMNAWYRQDPTLGVAPATRY